MKLNSFLLTIALYGAIIFLSVSCSPEKRLASILKNHQELIKHDTIFKIDTIKIESSSKDTIFKNQITKDTILIKENNLTIKYFNNRDSVFISGKCDTIIKLVKIPIETNSINIKEETGLEKFLRTLKDYLIVALLGAIIVLILLIKRSIKKI